MLFIVLISESNSFCTSRKINILSSSATFIKLLHQFDADIAEEEDLNANIKVINEEKLINFFIILIE